MKRTADAPLIAALPLTLLLLAGCPDDPSTGNTAPASSGPSTSTTSSAKPVVREGEIGIKECDDYVTKMRACIEKLPEADRAAKKAVMDKTLATMKEQSGSDDTGRNLVTTCAAALKALDTDPLCK
jgi:hypothetical protein